MTTIKTIQTRSDISAHVRDEIIAGLNQSLADTIDLYTQTKQAHWNVKGPQFFQLHELFDKLAAGLSAHIDLIAERATALGGLARGTARMAIVASRMPEYPLDALDGRHHLELLAERFAALAKFTRGDIDAASKLGDQGTADLYTEISRELDKNLWFLESHLQV